MFFIGDLRRFLFVPWSSRWNAWVRDITAKYEGTCQNDEKASFKFLGFLYLPNHHSHIL